MRKLVLDLTVAQILPEKINKMFLPKKLGFIDVLSTVSICIQEAGATYTSNVFTLNILHRLPVSTGCPRQTNTIRILCTWYLWKSGNL